MGKMQTFAGLPYSYVMICYFKLISVWRNATVFSELKTTEGLIFL